MFILGKVRKLLPSVLDLVIECFTLFYYLLMAFPELKIFVFAFLNLVLELFLKAG